MKTKYLNIICVIIGLLKATACIADAGGGLDLDLHAQYGGGGGTFKSSGSDFQPSMSNEGAQLVVDRLIWARTDADFSAAVAEGRNNLSFDQKIQALSYILGTFGDHYDTNRENQGASAPGTVTLSQLLSCVRDGTDCGICRDIHFAGMQLAKSLGIKVAYGLSYNSNSGAHADMIVQSPDGKLVLLDYGYAAYQTNKNPSGGVVQNSQLVGVGIRDTVYDSNGKPVANLPSDLGVLLHQLTDQPVSDLDPLASGRANNVATGGKTLLKHIRIFAAKGATPTGNRAQGVGVSGAIDSREFMGGKNSAYLSFRGAAMLYQNNNSVADIAQKIDSNGVYRNFHLEAGTPALSRRLSSGAELSLRGKASYDRELQYDHSIVTRPGFRTTDHSQYDLNEGFKAGPEVRFCSADGRTSLNAEAMVLGSSAYASMTDATKGVTNYIQGMEYRVEGKHQIDPSTALAASATLVQRPGELGTQGRFTLGVLERYHGFTIAQTVGVEGPLRGRSPAFVPGSQRQIDLGVSVTDPSERYTLGAKSTCPVGSGLKSCYLGGSLDVKF